ncbi:DUF4394 domain-containing protein [Pseudonocardia hydrocarbonoxydans]|uniref:DUF4394 domain-containing protein n=1 Tax=Pseudonocardia hydrocarbonoxydans TaxID=76726 RepID=A0A4Y3WNX1_9PSEU|nr:DUF4394 domain-containing protein [Pseudonocardia hydrocarbonoxydans]GEC20597.1 hypothetical protein PHY01_28800 [Pseudonocardia hydrocarbonoxydans]
MSTTFRRALIAAAAITTVSAAVIAPAAFATDDKGAPGKGLHAVGLVDGSTLVGFDTTDAGSVYEIGEVPLDKDSRLVGIDYRVQDGGLYGVGDLGGLYLIDDENADSELIGQLTVALVGDDFAVDFNPAANALRILSDTGQNLRQPFATTPLAATVADTPLTNPAVAPATGTVPALGVNGAAYTNNDLDAGTATTLFDLDTTLDRVAVQSPANAGTLAPTGSLPADIGSDVGFDIYTSLTDGVADGNTAFATVEVDGERHLWVVDVLTGGATDIGTLDYDVTDLAVQLDQ